MVRRQSRLLTTYHVIADAVLGMTAFALAYALRFESGLIPITKGQPPFSQYAALLPFVGLLVPLAFQTQGLYRLRRGRSRVDDFFAVFVGTIVAIVVGQFAALYVQAYFASDAARDRGAYEVSQYVWAIFLVLNVALTYASRAIVRSALERRFRAGAGIKRVLIAGAGDLGRLVAATGDHIGYRGLPLLGTLEETGEICQREQVDHLYVALPLEEHARMLLVIEQIGREMIDIHVVPDLLQFMALRARLEDLDGIPIISINDVPLQGLNSVLKRIIDVAISAVALLILTLPMGIIALLVRLTSPGPVFYRQERMGLDGKAFAVYKFRSMYANAEIDSGPVWARDDDPRCTPLGSYLRRWDLDELPQFWNVWKGDMSIVGPRPERPFFVAQFKQRIPTYMLRHKVKAGITGWAQVNGWRGNTSIEKRIEYDLYYIENWSVGLDLKIMWLTVLRGFSRAV
jgi:Undecaprenyl-phosphate glucose phosphotransferase